MYAFKFCMSANDYCFLVVTLLSCYDDWDALLCEARENDEVEEERVSLLTLKQLSQSINSVVNKEYENSEFLNALQKYCDDSHLGIDITESLLRAVSERSCSEHVN